MKKLILYNSIISGLLLIFACSSVDKKNSSDGQQAQSDPAKNGYVPDEATAIKIAEAVWLPIYGEKIYDEKPFHAILKGDSIWIVEGTVHVGEGGAVYTEIQKDDSRILKVTHFK